MIKLLEKAMTSGGVAQAGDVLSLSELEENVLVAHGKAEFVEVQKQMELPKTEKEVSK